jgi:hypothetical protein
VAALNVQWVALGRALATGGNVCDVKYWTLRVPLRACI